MKKIIGRIICIMLVLVCFTLVACRKDEPLPTDPNHSAVVKETDIPLIQNGKSDYKIVIPADADEWEKMGADELTEFFNQASGIKLQTVTDEQVSWSDSAKYLSIGETSLAESAGVSVDEKKFGESGYVVQTKGSSVFMLGGGSYGSLFAAYDFLKYHFNFEVFSEDAIRLEKQVTQKNLLDMQITEIPDIPWRVSAYGWVTFDPVLNKRFRMFDSNEIWMPVDGYTIHNSYQYVPYDTYKDSHPSWFATDGDNLCYTTRGNTEEFNAMKEVVVNKMLETIHKYPELSTISLTQRDNSSWCTCDSCSQMRLQYGNSDSASQIKFVNAVADDVKAALDAENWEKDITIMIFAYNRSEAAPAKANGDGTYSPIDDTVKLRDNVAVYYAPISADYSHTFEERENASFLETMNKWRALSNKLYMWTYSTNFTQYLMPFNTFNTMQDNYRYLKKMNTFLLFDQAQWDQYNGTAFHNLKSYLNAKLQWNVNYDFETLIDDYFATYFEEAAEPMKQYFDDLRTWCAYLEEIQGVYGDVYYRITEAGYWPKQTLVGFMNYIDKAYEAIEPVKATDPDRYQRLCDRICLESIFPRYALITLYGNKMTDSELTNMKKEFKSDAFRLEVSKASEATPISNLFDVWGV